MELICHWLLTDLETFSVFFVVVVVVMNINFIFEKKQRLVYVLIHHM